MSWVQRESPVYRGRPASDSLWRSYWPSLFLVLSSMVTTSLDFSYYLLLLWGAKWIGVKRTDGRYMFSSFVDPYRRPFHYWWKWNKVLTLKLHIGPPDAVRGWQVDIMVGVFLVMVMWYWFYYGIIDRWFYRCCLGQKKVYHDRFSGKDSKCSVMEGTIHSFRWHSMVLKGPFGSTPVWAPLGNASHRKGNNCLSFVSFWLL